MNWPDKCMLELTHRNLFEDDSHRARFRDLLDCYSGAPFFYEGPLQMHVPWRVGQFSFRDASGYSE